ncbi:TPA: MFS transporter [Stenotrophomonas maltophilia]|nr:MFS transporter [Stenotrophomonas maltophilia]
MNIHTSAGPSQKAGLSIFILAVAAFVLLTTEFLILGLLPPLARDLGISISVAGQLVTVFAVVVVLTGPPLAALVSHWPRKPLFLGILVVFAVSNGLSAVATDFWSLALARTLAAAALPVFWGTASESAAALVPAGRAGREVSQVYLGITTAFVFGIPLGTVAVTYVGWRGSFALLGALCLLVAALMAVFMPNVPGAPRAEGAPSQLSILRNGHFIANVLLTVLVFTGMFVAYTYLADTLERVVGVAPERVGWWLMGFGAVGMLGNVLGGRLVDRDAALATTTLLGMLAFGMAGVPAAAGWLPGVVLAMMVWAMAYTALFPVCQVRVMQAGAQAKALAGTMNVSASNAGIGLGAAIGGMAIPLLGLDGIGYLSAAIAVAGALVALMIRRGSRP